MPGTIVADALGEHYNGSITATFQTTAQEVNYPQQVQVEVATGTITGTGTLDIVIEGASDSGFTTDVVQYGAFGQIDQDDDDTTVAMVIYVDSRYLRANVTVGGTPTAPTVITLQEPHYHRVPDLGTQFPDSAP